MYGEYAHTIDAKGRIFLPAKFRHELGETVHLSWGVNKCICIFSEDEWEKFIESLRVNQKGDIKRIITSTSAETDVDSQGRILIPSEMRLRAGLNKTATVIGVGEKAEIWNPESFKEYKNRISAEEIEAELIALGM